MHEIDDIARGDKFTERVLNSEHPIIKHRVEYISALDYELHVHTSDFFDPSQPIFTIILTAYEANIAYVEESLKSVLAQSYHNTEVVLINNGAGSDVSELMWSAFVTHGNAKLIRTTKNLFDPGAEHLDEPVSNLWSAGLFCSVGDFVYFLSYDDFVSPDYAKRMVNVFNGNPNCCTAAPSVVSVDESSRINADISERFRAGNRRGRYTSGIALAESYMRDGDLILFPGGLLAIRSDVVIGGGGFDDMHDFSQLFKFAICGDSGFDPDAILYWRHHAHQANKLQKKMGLVYYTTFRTFADVHDMRELHERIAGMSFADEFMRWIERKSDEVALSSFRDSYRHGITSALSALRRVFEECPPRLGAKALAYLILDCPIVVYDNYVPMPVKNAYRRIKRVLRSLVRA